MPLDGVQLSALRVILRACADECIRGVLGNLLEGHLKVVAAEALLRTGHSILESANKKGQGRVLSLDEGRLQSAHDTRPTVAAFSDSGKVRMSPDLRVWKPCKLIVELQVRSSFGSQSALFSDNLYDDLRRVGTGAVDAFVLAADRPTYDALRGVKQDRRGRKAKYPEVLNLLLPASESLAQMADPVAWPSFTILGSLVSGTLLKTPFGVERCVIGVWAKA